MSAFEDAAREMSTLLSRISAIESELAELRSRVAAPARTAYKVTEAAAILGVHPNTVRARIAEGRLPAEDMGGWYAIPASAVDSEASLPNLGRSA